MAVTRQGGQWLVEKGRRVTGFVAYSSRHPIDGFAAFVSPTRKPPLAMKEEEPRPSGEFKKTRSASFVPDRAYSELVREMIDEARRSITVFMYHFLISNPDGEPAALVKRLAAAKKRGVIVKVYLSDDFRVGAANRYCAEKLAEAGIKANIVKQPMMHSKVLVVDGSRVLLGSHNWSTSAFKHNREMSAYFEDSVICKSLVQAILVRLSSAKEKTPEKQTSTRKNRRIINLNINKAPAHILTLLPGIGEGLAEKIIRYRETKGPFQEIEDIMKVEGFGPAKFEQIRGMIAVKDMPRPPPRYFPPPPQTHRGMP